jgi:hypothetical protein
MIKIRESKLVFLFVLHLVFYSTNCQSTVSLLNAVISWSNRGYQTDFKITTPLTGVNANDAWLAIGFNNVPKMANASVVVCRNNLNNTWVRQYQNSRYYHTTLFDVMQPSLGLTNSKVLVGSNSNFVCMFSRDNQVDRLGYYNITENTTPYMLVAYGSGEVSYHLSKRAVTSYPVSFVISTEESTRMKALPRTEFGLTSLIIQLLSWLLKLFGIGGIF